MAIGASVMIMDEPASMIAVSSGRAAQRQLPCLRRLNRKGNMAMGLRYHNADAESRATGKDCQNRQQKASKTLSESSLKALWLLPVSRIRAAASDAATVQHITGSGKLNGMYSAGDAISGS